MPTAAPPVCPRCQLSDQVYKVSTIYMTAIDNAAGGAGRFPPLGHRSETAGNGPERLTAMPRGELRRLVRRLAPPAGKSQRLSRLIHPDQMMMFFSLVLLVFIAGMLRSRADLLLPAVLILIALYAFYFLKRGQILQRFQQDFQNLNQTNQQIEAAVGVWMKLYYCAREEAVFLPREDELVPLDEMRAFTLKRGAARAASQPRSPGA